MSKALSCICHDLTGKLKTYGLSLSALKLIYNYLLNWKQTTKVGSLQGTLQGSSLGLLLFNTLLCDLIWGFEESFL